jgi:hypothetical protein
MNGDREALIRAYDEEEAAGFGLTDLAEDSDEETRQNGGMNGKRHQSGAGDDIELSNRKSAER